ncbi:ATP-binding cassette domain-containing protein [Pikeienuella sp. HZG-20]|uniref:thiamine ABC transporter ATP-binding protein n=1 Tax=Paludibacillus litoralis TaxID=3133267 RepID=UPI0030EE33F2
MLKLEGAEAGLGAFRLAGDLSLARGAHLNLIGPSGGGKSTLLNLIAGFVDLTRGRLLIDGRDMAGVPPARRPVTILFQEHNLFPHLDAAANVGLGLDPGLRLSKAERSQVAASLAEVGLAGLGSRRPADLSGGQRQRVALARALLRDRPVLLLDEPFAALGPAQRMEMVDLVATLRARRELTTIMATHAPDDARRAGGALSFIDAGRIGAPTPVAEALDAPPPALAAYLGGEDPGRSP